MIGWWTLLKPKIDNEEESKPNFRHGLSFGSPCNKELTACSWKCKRSYSYYAVELLATRSPKIHTSWRLDSSHWLYSKHTWECQSKLSIQTDHTSGEQYKIVWDDWRSLLKQTNIATLHVSIWALLKIKKLLIKRWQVAQLHWCFLSLFYFCSIISAFHQSTC